MSEFVTPCCVVEPEFTVRLSVRFPAEVYGHVTKSKIKKASATIEAADWHRVIWSCPKCHRCWPPGEFPICSEDS